MRQDILTNQVIRIDKRKRHKLKIKNSWQLLSMCLPPMILLFIFNYIPMGGLIIAFKDYRYDRGIFGSEWVGFKNFEFFVQSNDFLRITRNTLALNTIFIVTGTIAAIVVALLLYEITSRRVLKMYQTVLIIPYFISWVIVGYMAYALLSPSSGLINLILQGLGREAVMWYDKPQYWPAILTIASLWKSVGINCIIYYAAMMGIDNSYFEAAKIDGANKFQCVWHITLPSIKPLVSILTILAIGGILRADFGLFYQLPRDIGKLYATTDVIDTYIYRVMKTIGNMSMSAAVGFLQSIVGFALIMVTNRFANKIDDGYGLF